MKLDQCSVLIHDTTKDEKVEDENKKVEDEVKNVEDPDGKIGDEDKKVEPVDTETMTKEVKIEKKKKKNNLFDDKIVDSVKTIKNEDLAADLQSNQTVSDSNVMGDMFGTESNSVLADTENEQVQTYQKFNEHERVLLNIFLTMEETLYSKSLDPLCSDEFKKMFQNQSGRSFSSFGRLASFISFPSYGNIDLLDLCEQGAFNRSELEAEIRHVSAPNVPISPFIDERLFASDTWLQLIRELPHVNSLQCYPSENIPLHVTLNSMNSLC